jgi:hypothetical protein
MKYIIILFAFVLTGCGTVQKINPFDDGMTKVEKSKGEIPEWFLEPENGDKKFITAVATETSKDMQFAIDKAMMVAKVQLASKLKTDVEALTRSSSIESGVGIKDVEEETDRVQQTRVRQAIGFFKRERLEVFREKGGFRAYVMLKIKVDEARRLTDNKKDDGSREDKFKNLNQPTVEVTPIT